MTTTVTYRSPEVGNAIISALHNVMDEAIKAYLRNDMPGADAAYDQVAAAGLASPDADNAHRPVNQRNAARAAYVDAYTALWALNGEDMAHDAEESFISRVEIERLPS